MQYNTNINIKILNILNVPVTVTEQFNLFNVINLLHDMQINILIFEFEHMLKYEDDLRHYFSMTENTLNRHYKKSRSHFIFVFLIFLLHYFVMNEMICLTLLI